MAKNVCKNIYIVWDAITAQEYTFSTEVAAADFARKMLDNYVKISFSTPSTRLPHFEILVERRQCQDGQDPNPLDYAGYSKASKKHD